MGEGRVHNTIQQDVSRGQSEGIIEISGHTPRVWRVMLYS